MFAGSDIIQEKNLQDPMIRLHSSL